MTFCFAKAGSLSAILVFSRWVHGSTIASKLVVEIGTLPQLFLLQEVLHRRQCVKVSRGHPVIPCRHDGNMAVSRSSISS